MVIEWLLYNNFIICYPAYLRNPQSTYIGGKWAQGSGHYINAVECAVYKHGNLSVLKIGW